MKIAVPCGSIHIGDVLKMVEQFLMNDVDFIICDDPFGAVEEERLTISQLLLCTFGKISQSIVTKNLLFSIVNFDQLTSLLHKNLQLFVFSNDSRITIDATKQEMEKWEARINEEKEENVAIGANLTDETAF